MSVTLKLIIFFLYSCRDCFFPTLWVLQTVLRRCVDKEKEEVLLEGMPKEYYDDVCMRFCPPDEIFLLPMAELGFFSSF